MGLVLGSNESLPDREINCNTYLMVQEATQQVEACVRSFQLPAQVPLDALAPCALLL